MDEQTLQSLLTALAATPDNQALRGVVLRALYDGGNYPQAYEVVRRYPAGDFQAEQRLLAAAISLAAQDAERALLFADADTAEVLIVRARALLALNCRPEATQAYRQALVQNPTLEDAELTTLLGTSPPSKASRDEPLRLASLSNDDTDASEVVRLLHPEERRVTFSEVGGLADIKQHIHKKIILPFQKPTLFQRFRKRIGGGILLYGPPGCGKTLLARATAGECQAAFYNVAIADVLDMYIGESERKLRAIFEQARSHAPAVLFFDELEALGGKRQYTREGTSSKLVSQFLAEMDGFAQANQGVLILGATNVPWTIDPAFRRPGRFDRVLFVPPPDRAARQSILAILLADRPLGETIQTDFLAQQTSGFSGADLEAIVDTAIDAAIDDSLTQGVEVPLRNAHFRAALQQVKPTTLEWLTTARNYARYANEAGQYDEVLAFLNKYGKG